jgi:hypothetical protein
MSIGVSPVHFLLPEKTKLMIANITFPSLKYHPVEQQAVLYPHFLH